MEIDDYSTYDYINDGKTAEIERETIKSEFTCENDYDVGETYYVLSKIWWESWKRYTCFDLYCYNSYISSKTRPGPIDNKILLESDGETILPNANVLCIKESVWKKFHSWYGGGPVITRKCISLNGYPDIQLRKLSFRVVRSSKIRKPVKVNFWRETTIGEFINEMLKQMDFEKENIRVWDFMNGNKINELNHMDQTLVDARITEDQLVLIEEKRKNGSWPSNQKYRKYRSYSYYEPSEPGLTGMSNIGNTCFMNSSLQCLSHIVPLTDFFLTGKYLGEINKENEFGKKGDVATEYYNLLRLLWSSNTSVVEPRSMKAVIEKIAPPFLGNSQQDAQELMSYFLDGLHEDLNRIKEPYIPKVEESNQDDARSVDSWASHKARNDSFIVDYFQGLLKSTLTCPINGRVSVTYDPFMYLSVPIPSNLRKICVRVFFLENAPNYVFAEVPKYGYILDLKFALSNITGIPAEVLVICDISYSRINYILDDDNLVEKIGNYDTIYAYEVSILCSKKQEDYNIIQAPSDDITPSDSKNNDSNETSLKKENGSNVVYILCANTLNTRNYYATKFFGAPLVISVPNNITYRQLYSHLISRLSPILRNIPDTNIPLEDKSDDETSSIYISYNVYPPRYGALFEISPSDDNDKLLPIFKNDDSSLNLTHKLRILLKWSEKTKMEYNIGRDDDEQGQLETDKKVSLYECLDLYSTEERLTTENAWYCPECKEFREALKKISIWNAPKILVIHLKRFLYWGGLLQEKIEQFVDFPLENLDLSKYIIGPTEIPPIYDLCAITDHYGTLGMGHYTASVKHRDDGKWYLFDDEQVKLCNESKIASANAYVLFYKRKDIQWVPFDRNLIVNDSEESSEDIENDFQNDNTINFNNVDMESNYDYYDDLDLNEPVNTYGRDSYNNIPWDND